MQRLPLSAPLDAGQQQEVPNSRPGHVAKAVLLGAEGEVPQAGLA